VKIKSKTKARVTKGIAKTKGRACRHKSRFSSQSFAERVADYRNGRYGLEGWSMRYHVYRCPHCGGFHVGHTS
jgi:hypothetical protein